MVSFPTPLPPTQSKMMLEFENSRKKRKWEESEPDETTDKPTKARSMKHPIFDNQEPQQETPLPLEWQRCLDIKSGQLYFYNTRTHKRTTSDPRVDTEPEAPGGMSLDLQLNLPCGSVKKKTNNNHDYTIKAVKTTLSGDWIMDSSSTRSGLARSPSWLTTEGDQKEMVTAVCKKCHMLVIMCKSSPTCPHCKFVHPPNQSPSGLF